MALGGLVLIGTSALDVGPITRGVIVAVLAAALIVSLENPGCPGENDLEYDIVLLAHGPYDDPAVPSRFLDAPQGSSIRSKSDSRSFLQDAASESLHALAHNGRKIVITHITATYARSRAVQVDRLFRAHGIPGAAE